MPLFKTKFHVDYRHIDIVDDTVHPLFESIKPLTPSQMLRRAMNGQPINVHNYSNEERLIFQKRFFGGDKLDVYDSVLLAKNRLAEKFKHLNNKSVNKSENNNSVQDSTPSSGVAQ